MSISFATHSLGARFAQGGIQFIRHSPCPECFGRAALFAPDVDGHLLFSELTGLGLCPGKPHEHPTSSAPVTLYASNRDLALRQSQRLSGRQRAGQAGSELILCPGVDTIDVSHFNGEDRVGHNYHIEPRIIRDAAAAFAGTAPTAPSRDLKPCIGTASSTTNCTIYDLERAASDRCSIRGRDRATQGVPTPLLDERHFTN